MKNYVMSFILGVLVSLCFGTKSSYEPKVNILLGIKECMPVCTIEGIGGCTDWDKNKTINTCIYPNKTSDNDFRSKVCYSLAYLKLHTKYGSKLTICRNGKCSFKNGVREFYKEYYNSCMNKDLIK